MQEMTNTTGNINYTNKIRVCLPILIVIFFPCGDLAKNSLAMSSRNGSYSNVVTVPSSGRTSAHAKAAYPVNIPISRTLFAFDMLMILCRNLPEK